MMEILAENRFTITKSLFFEGMLRVSAENYGKFAKKAVAFLGLAWVVLVAVTLWLQQSPVYVGMELIILCMAGMWVAVFMPHYQAGRAFRGMKRRGGGLERITRFYPDRLEVDASGEQTVVYYSEITQILPAKRLLVLVTADKTGVLLKRDSFLSGSEAVVRELIGQANSDGSPQD